MFGELDHDELWVMIFTLGDEVSQDFVDGSEDESQDDFGLFLHNVKCLEIIT